MTFAINFYLCVIILLGFAFLAFSQDTKVQTGVPYKQIGDDVEIIGLGSFKITTKHRKLSIAIRRLSGLNKWYWFCIGPIEGSHAGCPVGHQRLHFEGNGQHFTIISEFNLDTGVFVNHKYRFELYKVVGDVIWIHANKDLDGMSVKLLSSTIYEDPPEKKAMSPLTITLIVLGCGVVLIILVVVGIVLWSHYRARKMAAAAVPSRRSRRSQKSHRIKTVSPVPSSRRQRSSNRAVVSPVGVVVTPTSPVPSSESERVPR
uniref:IG domain-containing protein n=1 Tax=Panagrellus redivivus TaxID=6233 RepID=A0A7E4ZWZ2_PANRE